ncbi:MAG: hypothetical protein KME49_28920 [Brasilonema octagenarum HA4186-MV1]|jgi:hypothetical protein|nr:hypothetical protein [Brasilonema octagenarum HA4186-MV1]
MASAPQDRAGSPFSRTQPRPPGNQFPGSQFKSTKVDSKAYAVVFRRLLLSDWGLNPRRLLAQVQDLSLSGEF